MGWCFIKGTSYFELAKIAEDHDCAGQYMRLSCALEKELNRLDRKFPKDRKLHLRVLKQLCHEANRSSHFFGTDNDVTMDMNQWLRTSITFKSEPVFRNKRVDEAHMHARIHSNVLPCQEYERTLRSVQRHTDVGTSRSCQAFFPHEMLECEKESLPEMLIQIPKGSCALENALRVLNAQRGLVSENRLARGGQREFIRIQSSDVTTVRSLNSGSEGSVSEISWLNGTFVKKEFFSNIVFEREATIASKISHPNVVRIFGTLVDDGIFSVLMEMLNEDLRTFLIERAKVTKEGEPPFSRLLWLDVLMQVAEAMKHLHMIGVIHFDLKSLNILLSHVEITGTEHDDDEYFLVKVADFGQAQLLQFNDPSFPGFNPGLGTTAYTAPEVLEWFDDRSSDRGCLRTDPRKADVYSFGIVAFEVLTGNFEVYGAMLRTELRKRVKDGTLRPLLRQECKPDHYPGKLLSLVESCWHPDPEQRPSFDDICVEMVHMRDELVSNNGYGIGSG